MKSFACSLFVITAILLPQNQQPNQEKALRQRVELFYSMFSSGRNEGMWNMLSARLRRENDNNKKKYLSDLPKPGGNRAEAHIKQIHVNGRRANVGLRIAIVANSGEEIGWEEHEDSWVFERGRWRFDGSETLDYKKNP